MRSTCGILLLLWAAQALAQPAELFVAPPFHPGATPQLPGLDAPRNILMLPAQVDLRAVYASGSHLRANLSPTRSALLTVGRFDPTDTPWPLPADAPDSAISFTLQAVGDGVYLWMSVYRGGVFAFFDVDDTRFLLEGRGEAMRLRWPDAALGAADDVYPPFPPMRFGDQVLTLALPDLHGRLSPGATTSLQMTVRNLGPDVSDGGVIQFDQAPIAGRLHLVGGISMWHRGHTACGTVEFRLPGLPTAQVLRIRVPPLAGGEEIVCTIPATLLGWRDATLRARLHPRNPTHFYEDPQAHNNDAVVVIAGRGAPPPLPPIRVPGPTVAWLGALAVLILAGGAPVSRRRTP